REVSAWIGDASARTAQKPGRRIDTQHGNRFLTGHHGLGQRPGAAANIQPTTAPRHRQPGQERPRYPPAPPPHIRLIGIGAQPNASRPNGHHVALPSRPVSRYVTVHQGYPTAVKREPVTIAAKERGRTQATAPISVPACPTAS